MKELRQQKFQVKLEQKGGDDNRVIIELDINEKDANLDEDQDELREATNWKRAFEKIYTQIKWLNAYAIINQIAAQKILKKFTKNTF